MFNVKSNAFFRKIDNAVWDLTTGKIGFKEGDAVITFDGDAITSNPQIGDMPIPAFALPTNVTDIQVGDLVINNGDVLGWVRSIPGRLTVKRKAGEAKLSATFELITKNGLVQTWEPPKGILFGNTSVVRNLATMFGGSTGGLQQQLLPLMMFSDGKFGDDQMSKLLPLILMQQTSGVKTDGGLMSAMMMASLFKQTGR